MGSMLGYMVIPHPACSFFKMSVHGTFDQIILVLGGSDSQCLHKVFKWGMDGVSDIVKLILV